MKCGCPHATIAVALRFPLVMLARLLVCLASSTVWGVDGFQATPFTMPPIPVFDTTTSSSSLPTTITTVVPPAATGYEDVSLSSKNCSLVFDVTMADHLNLHLQFGPSDNAFCVLTFHTSHEYYLGLQVSSISLAPGVFQCELEGIRVYTLTAVGGLFLIDQFCGKVAGSPVLLSNSQSVVLTLRYGTRPNQTAAGTAFNLHAFTYAPQNRGYSWWVRHTHAQMSL